MNKSDEFNVCCYALAQEGKRFEIIYKGNGIYEFVCPDCNTTYTFALVASE
jgi:hypothetical protein